MFVSTVRARPRGRAPCEPLRERPGAAVVLGEPGDGGGRAREPRRREDPHLPHPAAEHLPARRAAPRSPRGPASDRADRRAEPLREADGHRVERRRAASRGPSGRSRPRRSRAARRRGGAARPCACAEAHERAHAPDRRTRPPHVVVRVLERRRRRVRGVVRVLPRVDDSLRSLRVERSRVGRRACASAAPESAARPARLVAEDVASRSPRITSSPGRVRAQERDLVRHRPRRHEERRLLAEQLGDRSSSALDGRVVAEDVVADPPRHRLPHRRPSAASPCRSAGRSRASASPPGRTVAPARRGGFPPRTGFPPAALQAAAGVSWRRSPETAPSGGGSRPRRASRRAPPGRSRGT